VHERKAALSRKHTFAGATAERAHGKRGHILPRAAVAVLDVHCERGASGVEHQVEISKRRLKPCEKNTLQ
jgi:hypothetical protein